MFENMTSQQYEQATQLVVKSFNEGVDNDGIEEKLYTSRLASFKHLAKLRKQIMQEQGILLSAAQMRDQITAIIDTVPFDQILTWPDVEKLTTHITKTIKGCTSARALTAVRNYATANEIVLPSRPKRRASGQQMRQSVIELFRQNPLASAEDLKASLMNEGGVSKESTANSYVNTLYEIVHELVTKDRNGRTKANLKAA